MKTIIGITGASGMLGKHLLHILSKKKISVVATSKRLIRSKNKNIIWKKLNLIDLKNESQLDNVFGNINTIVHIGALVPKANIKQDKKKIKKINFDSTLIITKWALKKNIHLIYISGAIIYENKGKKKIKEISNLKTKFFKDFYGSSKKKCDLYLQKKIKSGNKISILRPSSIYGFGLDKNKIINQLIKLSKSNKDIRLYGPFDKINLIHAIYVAEAIYKTIVKKKYKIFNIGSNKLYSIKDLSKILIKINKSKSKLKIKKNMNISNIDYKYNISSLEAKKNLQWSSKVSIINGVKLLMQKKYG